MAENFKIQDGITFPDGTSQTTSGGGTTLPADAVGVLTNDGAGNLSWTSGSGGTPAETYKGFRAVYGRMYNQEGAVGTINKIVIHSDTVTPTADISTAISDDSDYFKVTGLTGSDFVGLFNVYGTNSTPLSVPQLKLFTKAVIDNVILAGGVEGSLNTIADMKTAFYTNYSTIAAEAGDLYPDFEFYNNNFSDIATTTVQGSGIVFTVTNNLDNTYTPNFSLGGTNWQVGHQILVTGSQLGGVNGDNDVTITVASVIDGVIDSVTASGVSTGDGITYNGLNYSHYNDGYGFRATFRYNFTNNTLSNANVQNPGQYFKQNDIVTLSGTDLGGESPANDMTFRITSVYGWGQVSNYELVSGSPPAGTFPTEHIYDGGNDQYDDGNYIYTDIMGDSYVDGPSNEFAAVLYNGGNVTSDSTWFGTGSSYAVLYDDSIFGLVVTGAAIDWIGTNGGSGWDNSGNADSGDIFDPATSGEITSAPYLTLTNDGFVVDQFNGDEVLFSKSNYGNEIDIIDTDVQITRDNNSGPYNPVTDGSYNGDVIGNTEWNADGWNTLSDVTTRTYYNTAREAFTYYGNDTGNNHWPRLVGHEFIMHDTNNDKYYTFKFTNWQISNNGGGMEYVRRQINTDAYFVKTDYGSEIDEYGNGTAITRGNNQGIYNPYDEGSWNSDQSPGGTLWNTDGWTDLSNVTSRNYVAFYSAVTLDMDGLGRELIGRELVMYDTNNDEYYAIKFLKWTQGSNGGGFQYYRRKIDKANLTIGIKFADGTRQTTAYIPEQAHAKKWNSPNGSMWRIEEYNSGAVVQYNGSDEVWWDADNSPSGNGLFRGAIIEYHAYIDSGGTIIGTIHLANDYNVNTATHTEHYSGNDNINKVSLWTCNSDYGKLYFSRTDGNSDTLYIQWTSRVFYGSEYYC